MSAWTPVVNLMVGSDRPTIELLERVEFQVGQCWYKHQRVVTTDDHGINAEVARQCALHGVDCTIIGTGARAANGARGTYIRVLVEKGITRAERIARRDAFALNMADRVVTFGMQVKTEKWTLDVSHHKNAAPNSCPFA
jgi:hypothetical protein